MAEAVKKEKEAVKKEEPKKQGFFSKLKDATIATTAAIMSGRIAD